MNIGVQVVVHFEQPVIRRNIGLFISIFAVNKPLNKLVQKGRSWS
jgi:predicted urease superfamily metal-dependent hydrolase